ncbi:HAD family hydrolase [Treponema sp. OMZ 787]|uniref:HAD family hydrolase n=1 Tax=Treponema sp. OMZ 787 TaxID=2563669 RepID=UPI0020A47197|nr:HAD family hydrolase [Treponema sp. OMZ 787]UTC61280.1 HAD family hydrolase [Treponema sp. OMZ 787]
MKSPKMIIFDYGNTLIYEKELDLHRAYKALYAQIHKNLDKISFASFYEKGMAIFEKVRSRALQNDLEIHTHSFYNCLFQSLNIEFELSYTELELLFWEALAPCWAMPGIEKLLLFLESKNIRTGVISNIAFSGKALTARINKYLPQNKFEFIIASSEYGFRKPDSLLFEAALKKANLSADEVWYCGDNPRADVIGSAALGIKPVLFTSNLACPYDNESHVSPDFEFTEITDWNELIDLLSNIEY